jgi:hypothetical protein
MISVERVKTYAGLFGLLVLVFAPVLSAQTVGTTTADFLKINDGAVPAGMGGCYTAMGQDIYSISYNPAGLSYIRASQMAVMHLDSLASIQYEYFSFASGTNSNVFATNITYRHQPPIDNGNGNPPVNADDLAVQGGYAFKFSDSFRCGLTLKYIQSDLAGYTASTVAMDAGVVLDKLPYGLRAGLSIQNLGPGMNFDPNAKPAIPPDPLPMFIRFGLGTHQVLDGGRDMNLAIEVFKPSDQDIKMGLGGEFWLFPQLFAVRAGYKIEGLGTPTQNVFQDYTLGVTLTRDFDGDDFSLDIAYDPADFSTTLEDTFFFAINIKFNQLHLL